jgi:DNA polymerase
MGEQVFKPVEEFREIVSHLRKLMVANMEMGLETPRLSTSTLNYLSSRPSGFASLEDLRKYLGDCKRCKLGYGRTNLVFGEGSPEARLVFVGEGPGREEDQAGHPFVGEAGRLLTKIIKAMGLSRDEVYICNVVKCRPPKNRDPEEDEVESCLPFLQAQLDLIRPQVICTLGRIAAQGRWHSFMDIPLMPTYHPAYLLRNPSAKRQVWDDIQKIMRHMGLEVKKDA